MLQILYIAFYFPPLGGAGVQRSLKFVKHLRDFDIDPVILTTTGSNTSKWAPKDETLLAELPESLIVRRLPWLKPGTNGYDLSTAEAAKFLDEATEAARGVDAIFVTMSPFEDAAIAKELSRRIHVPWIADLRDPWGLDEFQTYRTFLHRAKVRKRMSRALSGASLIIMNTPESAHLLAKSFPELASANVSHITNGYDADDFANPKAAPETLLPQRKYNVVHTGTFHTALGLRQKKQTLINKLLGRTHPGVEFLARSPYYLLKALKSLKDESPLIASDFNLVFAGSISKEDRSVIDESGVAELVSTPGYVDHGSSVSLLNGANALFFPMHAIENKGRSSIVPGKAYEYMASGRTIIAAVPEGDAADFLTKSGNCLRCAPNDIESLKHTLKTLHQLWMNQQIPSQRDFNFVSQFERRELTRKLALELKRCATSDATNKKIP